MCVKNSVHREVCVVAWGAACMVATRGGMHGCHQGAYMVALGGMRGCLGACVVVPSGHAWLLLGGHVWLLLGGCMGYDKIWRYEQ